MDSQPGHDGGTEGEGVAGEGLASQPSDNRASSDPQIPTEPAEPESGPGPEPEPEMAMDGGKVETSERGAAADEQAETLERPDVTAGDEELREQESSAESPEPEEPAKAGAEEPAEPEVPEDKAKTTKGKEIRFRSVLPLGTSAEGPRTKQEDEEEGMSEDDYEWSEEIRKVQEQQLRGELVDQYHALLLERNRYQRYNVYLQHKISEALRKKGLEAGEVQDKNAEPEAPEKEQAYLGYLAMLEELKKQEADDLEWYHREVSELKQQCQEKQARVEKEWRRFQALKKQVVMQVMGSCRMRGGRQAALREVEQIQALEDKKEKEMSALRLENVQLKQSLVHFETRMKAQEDLAEGLLLIDFEQLKIENQTFNEKVEERNEELLKLRSKVTSNVQIITHVKEKLHFMDMENACKKTQVLEIEAQVALGRDILTKTKQARDSLRLDNIKLNQKCGLLGKESLLRDLEEKVEKTKLLNCRLESLKRHHAGLTLSCKGMKQKIREAKAFLPS
uniref:Coiled-coil domain containing 96 n=1 Tax=Jaculus jaculus TaxID=51337 RepID=A0A8C5LM62_JACJA